MSVDIDGEIYFSEHEFETDVITNDGYNSLYLLERQRLVTTLWPGWREAEGYAFWVSGVLMTQLGFDFYCRCSGRSRATWRPDGHPDAWLGPKPRKRAAKTKE